MPDTIIVQQADTTVTVQATVQQVTVSSSGERGPQGVQGVAGSAATVVVGSTTTGVAGSAATVVNSGTSSAAVLDFTIPQGATGATGQSAQREARSDWSSPYSYIGIAAKGTSETTALWKVARIQVSGSTVTVKQATPIKWSDRYTATYV